MINKKSKKQKAAENERTSDAVKTQIEDLFLNAFQMDFDFDDDIQQCRLSLSDFFQKFCACEFDSKQHNRAIVSGRARYNAGMPPLGNQALFKLEFERDMLKPGELNGIKYKAVQLDCVRTSNGTGKPCDMYFIFLYNQYGRPINNGCWLVKDYPQDSDFYHRYGREKRLASARRFRGDK
jgi:hypothetical protein